MILMFIDTKYHTNEYSVLKLEYKSLKINS